LIAARVADFHKRRNIELKAEQLRDLRQIAHFIMGQNGFRPLQGFIRLGDSVAQIAFRPFDNGNVLLVGKYVDNEEISRVSALTKFVIDVSPVDVAGQPVDFIQARVQLTSGSSFHTAVLNDSRISGYSLFNDIYGHPVLILKITEPRLIYEQGKISITYVILALVISGLIFCLVMLFFIKRTVLKRLATLSSTVGDISRLGDISARLEIDGEDELEDLAGSINTMLESLESAEQTIRDKEERYRVLFERAPDSIIIIGTEGDERGRIVAANRAAAKQHGYSVEELCSLSINELNTPETNNFADEIMEKIVNGEWITSELWHLRKDGSQFPIEIHAGLVKLGNQNYVLGFDRDITSRKLAEESDRMYLDQISQLNIELGVKAAELSVSNKELESFNYSVSHDMRGPLTRISGYCQLMLDDGSGIDSQTRTYLQRIYESCDWLDEMLDAMLKLSRLARAEFLPIAVDLSAIAEEVMRELIQAEPDRLIDVIIEPGVKATGDAQLLKILLSNLINNSWKYSAGEERARIEFGAMNCETLPVCFIRDNGVGFDMKDADKLFRVFTRLHDSTKFSGSGIGLATVQRVVARHGGRIWAESEVGCGATFFFTLVPDVPGLAGF
jgi:PAS domain S-box-containing protein